MRNKCVKPADQTPSRRDVLLAAAATAVGGLVSAAVGAPRCGESPSGDAPQGDAPTTAPADPAAHEPWWLGKTPSGTTRSRVVVMSAARVTRGAIPGVSVIDAMLSQSLQLLTNSATDDGAWRAILGDRQKIVIKFNSVGARELGTNEHVARAILRQLRRADYDMSRIVLMEAAPALYPEFGCASPAPTWAGGLEIGPAGKEDTPPAAKPASTQTSDRNQITDPTDRAAQSQPTDAAAPEPIAQCVAEAEAIINVGLLKTHRFAGMSACMKNLAYGVIRHPARYHANGCSPFVGRIIGTPQISTPLRLNIVNALRLVIRGGPEVTDGAVQDYGALLFGFDPVAVDFVAADALAVERKRQGLGGMTVKYLDDAIASGVGRGDWSRIERMMREVGT